MVCGCSFSAVSTLPEYAGTSWSEVLAKKLDWNLVNLARQGCSNGGIRLQIEEVLKQKPSFAIIVPTGINRMEIPACGLEEETNILTASYKFLENLVLKKPIKGYDRNLGVDNLNYGHNDYRLISETMFSLTSPWQHTYRKELLKPEIHEAVRQYIMYLYDSEWKMQQDEWILRDGLNQLHQAKIPFLVFTSFTFLQTAEKLKLLMNNSEYEKYLIDDERKSPIEVCNSHPYDKQIGDPGYHTSPEGQLVVAENCYDIIKNRWNLC